MTRPNGVTTDYTYDNLSRLLSVLHKLSGSTIDGATYTVDAVGNRTQKVNHLSGAPRENYTYDSIYQLTQVAQAGPTTTESYSYDPVGNRLSSLAAATWSYNASNHLTSISGSPGTTFTYDNNGNTLTKVDSGGTTTYAWDYENRLTSVTLPSTAVVSFKYDPLGRRIQKATPSATTIFAYDGENIVEETNATGAAQARFAMGLSIDEPLAQLRASTTHLYHADGLGSITSLTSGAGAVAASYTYNTFGDVKNSSGSVSNPFRYTGREWDAETGLYYYRARYYQAASGRFLSEDPLGFLAGINFFSYVRGNPTNLLDPMGLAECQDKKQEECAQEVARLLLDRDLFARPDLLSRADIEYEEVRVGTQRSFVGIKHAKVLVDLSVKKDVSLILPQLGTLKKTGQNEVRSKANPSLELHIGNGGTHLSGDVDLSSGLKHLVDVTKGTPLPCDLLEIIQEKMAREAQKKARKRK